jgi:hypothetical protein
MHSPAAQHDDPRALALQPLLTKAISIDMAEPTSDIAVIGLAVMGQNLILNMNDHGFIVTAFNRTTSKVDDFMANEAKGTNIVGAHSIEEMMATLKKPRRVMLLVKAGSAVDQFIETLLPHTEEGDIIIDGEHHRIRSPSLASSHEMRQMRARSHPYPLRLDGHTHTRSASRQAAIRSSPTRSSAPSTSSPRDGCSSAPASPVERRALERVLQSCLAGRPRRGLM